MQSEKPRQDMSRRNPDEINLLPPARVANGSSLLIDHETSQKVNNKMASLLGFESSFLFKTLNLRSCSTAVW